MSPQERIEKALDLLQTTVSYVHHLEKPANVYYTDVPLLIAALREALRIVREEYGSEGLSSFADILEGKK